MDYEKLIKTSKKELWKEGGITGCYFVTINRLEKELEKIQVGDIQHYSKIYSSKLIEEIGNCVIMGDETVKMLVEKQNRLINDNIETFISGASSNQILLGAKSKIINDIDALKKGLKVGYNEKNVEKLYKEHGLVPTIRDVKRAVEIGKVSFLNSALSSIWKYDIMPMDVGVDNFVLNNNQN